MSTPIDFYFDFSSPYGYFASLEIEKLAAQYKRDVQWHGILLGPAFKRMGIEPLANTPIKGGYAQHDMVRTARFHNILFRQPDVFPIATQSAARALLWIQQQHSDKAVTFIHTIFSAYFTENIDISQVDTVVRIAADLGVDATALRTALEDPALKAQLRSAVDASLERGVFGSPFIIVDNEQFWGFDRFNQLAAWLANGKI